MVLSEAEPGGSSENSDPDPTNTPPNAFPSRDGPADIGADEVALGQVVDGRPSVDRQSSCWLAEITFPVPVAVPHGTEGGLIDDDTPEAVPHRGGSVRVHADEVPLHEVR